MKRIKNVQTPDNWFPTATNGTVRVFLDREPGKGPNCWRVGVWGDDDFGLERIGMDITTCFSIFRGIKDGITQKKLKELGFKPV